MTTIDINIPGGSPHPYFIPPMVITALFIGTYFYWMLIRNLYTSYDISLLLYYCTGKLTIIILFKKKYFFKIFVFCIKQYLNTCTVLSNWTINVYDTWVHCTVLYFKYCSKFWIFHFIPSRNKHNKLYFYKKKKYINKYNTLVNIVSIVFLI